MQGIYHQSLTGNQGQLGPFDPSIMTFLEQLEKEREAGRAEGRDEERVNTEREKARADAAEKRIDAAEKRADELAKEILGLEKKLESLKNLPSD